LSKKKSCCFHLKKIKDFAKTTKKSKQMELLDVAFCLLAVAYLLVAARAYWGMEEDDTTTHHTHFSSAAMLLIGMLAIVYLRAHGGRPCMDFASTFPGMTLRNKSKSSRSA
jgi:hypothetical protein